MPREPGTRHNSAPLEQGGSLGGRAIYKHLAPLGRNEVNCVPVPSSRFPVHSSRFTVSGSRFTLCSVRAKRFHGAFMHPLGPHVAPVFLKFFRTKIRIGCSFFIL